MESNKTREIWIDNVKVVACILVVLGHFFQSMVKSGIIQENALYGWFNTTVYTFHVQLFFICSGYLYQKYSVVDSFSSWKSNVIKKALTLGVPYLFFSTASWVIKLLFAGSVNTQNSSFFNTLIIDPMPPYWYLYILFFIFLITPTIKSGRTAIILLVLSGICKLYSILFFYTGIYLTDYTFYNWLLFVIGMVIAKKLLVIPNLTISIILFLGFLMYSCLAYLGVINLIANGFIMCILACCSIIGLFHSEIPLVMQRSLRFISKYTMPIFLMHTIFAASFRSVLLKLGVLNVFIHFIVGIIISFVGPIIAMIVMEKLKPLDFLVYPNRYFKKE